MRRAIFLGSELGALLAVVAQFLPLFHTQVRASAQSVGSQSVGSAHAYSVLLLAVLAAFLGVSVLLSGNRFALALCGLLGITVLAIALGHDLSAARASGVKSVGGSYVSATNVVASGLYLEIAGALLLLLSAALGFLLGGAALETVRPQPKLARTASGRRRDSSDRRSTGVDRPRG